MRLDLIPEGLLERAAFAAGVVPTPIAQLVWSVGLARSFIAALRLGVFEAIEAAGPGGASPEDVAARLSCDGRGLRTLLSALNGFGLLRRRRGRFLLTPAIARFAVRSSKKNVRDALEFGELLDTMLRGMEHAVRTGERAGFHQSLDTDGWRRYERGLAAFARQAAGEVVRKLPLRAPPRRLLDVGGGHGLYSAAMARRWPDLLCEVLDLPQACAVGREIIRDEGMADRVAFREGDLRTASWGEGHDVVLLFNVVHNLPADGVRQALARAAAALKPGGVLAILEGENQGGDGDLDANAGFGTLLFYVLSDSELWPEEALRGWLAEAGFTGVRRRRLMFLPGTLLLVATRR